MKTIAIIGGGAAGMMAGICAKERDSNCSVTLFEKNAYLGAKVLISGGGRCNVTTGIFDVKELLKNYPRGAKFLVKAMFRFPPEKVMAWFEARGVPLQIEKDLRVFPKSNNGKDVVGALESYLVKKGVRILLKSSVSNISHDARVGGRFSLTWSDGKSPVKSEFFDAVIITTGGNAYRHTGSTGDGHAFAIALGHTVTPLAPSLSSFTVREEWVADLAGVSFEKVSLHLSAGAAVPENPVEPAGYERTGPVVFTHRGVSGPAVFALSGYAAYEKITPQNYRTLTIDFFPDETFEAFSKRFFALLQKNPKKSLLNFLDILLPKSMCCVAVKLSNNLNTSIVGSLSKTNRENIISLLKEFPLTLVGRSAGEEFVTAGGVSLSEVNANTMESRIVSGLYFAGEILDVDGFTGGYNLQSSWATGALAGEFSAGR